MTDPIGLALVVTLAGIGLIHLAWALGMNWPGTDPVSRAAFVVGTTNVALLGFAGWSAIAVCFFAAVGVVWIGQQPIIHPLRALVAYGGYAVLITVFGLRGLAPYITHIFDYARSTPFYGLNRRYYAPLCIALATGLIVDFPTGLEEFLPN